MEAASCYVAEFAILKFYMPVCFETRLCSLEYIAAVGQLSSDKNVRATRAVPISSERWLRLGVHDFGL